MHACMHASFSGRHPAHISGTALARPAAMAPDSGTSRPPLPPDVHTRTNQRSCNPASDRPAVASDRLAVSTLQVPCQARPLVVSRSAHAAPNRRTTGEPLPAHAGPTSTHPRMHCNARTARSCARSLSIRTAGSEGLCNPHRVPARSGRQGATYARARGGGVAGPRQRGIAHVHGVVGVGGSGVCVKTVLGHVRGVRLSRPQGAEQERGPGQRRPTPAWASCRYWTPKEALRCSNTAHCMAAAGIILQRFGTRPCTAPPR